jgi:hypothetical protein
MDCFSSLISYLRRVSKGFNSPRSCGDTFQTVRSSWAKLFLSIRSRSLSTKLSRLSRVCWKSEVETWLVQPHPDRSPHFSFDAFECRGLFLVFLLSQPNFAPLTRTSSDFIFSSSRPSPSVILIIHLRLSLEPQSCRFASQIQKFKS